MDLFWLMVLEPGKSRGRGLQCIWYMVGGGTSGYVVTLWEALCGEAEDTPALPPFPTYSPLLPQFFLPFSSLLLPPLSFFLFFLFLLLLLFSLFNYI